MQPPYNVWVPQIHTPWNGGYISDIWDISSFDTNNQDTIIHNNNISWPMPINPKSPQPAQILPPWSPFHLQIATTTTIKPPYTSLIVTGMVAAGGGGTCCHRESVIDPQCITPNHYRWSQKYHSHPNNPNFLKPPLLPFKIVVFSPYR